ncbi:MAG: TlpA family protein disulfide reductase [Deltaproteobacteria bacterium]|nr:TlpA family protein disulfide reductase [Nannocystaceae bacterium]
MLAKDWVLASPRPGRGRGESMARARGIVGALLSMVIATSCGTAAPGVDGAGVDVPSQTQDLTQDLAQELPPIRSGEDRVGVAAPALEVEGWVAPGDDPGSIEALRGRVVLIRFWTDTCPYCRASAPALVALDDELADRGLVVLAIHHPKPRGSATDREHVARIAEQWGLRFPVGLDEHWRTIDSWWLGSGERAATSATLLVDRRGIIRWVHPGPEYHPDGPADHARCRSDFADLRAAAVQLLAEP